MPGEKEVEKSDDSALEFAAAADVDSSGRKGLPDDALTNVGGDEQVDTTAESIALLEEFVEEDDNQSSNNKLDDEQKADTGTKILGLTVEASEDVDGSLAEGNDKSEH